MMDKKENVIQELIQIGQWLHTKEPSKNRCSSRCVWLRQDGEKGVCFWKECVYDQPRKKEETAELPHA